MAERELPELRTRLRLDTAEAERGAKAAARRMLSAFDDPKALSGLQSRLSDFSNKADEFGSKMTRNVTLPVVAAGAASFKMASDFNSTFTQMQTLAGVTAGEVEGLKGSVMDLSGETARAPQELAKGLYFIRSAGLDGADALDTLEASAKGSAIGLGDTAAVADVTTSALNTYGPANLSAARAVDILAASVAVGKGEAAEFAPQLGNLLPIAQKLGIGFDQVAGSVAFLTQTNGDVARSATMVAGVLQKLQAPTEQGRKVLEGVGLSADQVRKYLAENGLIATLQMLDKALGGNSDQLRRVFDDIEGFNGVLGLLRNGGTDASRVLDEVANSAGYLDDAFDDVQDTDEFKFQQALADLQATAIEVGTKLIPIFTDIAGVVGGMVGAFTELPAPVQSGIIAVAGMAAVLGPVAKGASLAADGVGLLIKVARSETLANFTLGLSGVAAQSGGTANALGSLIATAAASPAAWGVAAVGVGGLVYALTQMESQAEQTEAAARNLQAAAEQTGQSIEEVFRKELARSIAGVEKGSLDQSGGNVDAVARGIRAAAIDAKELGDALLGTDQQYEAMVAKAQAAADELLANDPTGWETAQAAAIQRAIEAFANWRQQGIIARGDQEELTRVETELGIATDTTTSAIEGQTDALGEQSTAFDDAITAARDLFDARQAEVAGARAVADAEAEVADRHQATIDAEQRRTELAQQVTQARREQAAAIRAADQAAADGARQVADATRAVDDAEAAHAETIEQVRIETEGLTAARQDAVRSLEDLERANRGDILSEKEARLALKEAQRDLRRAKPADREAAALRVERAQLALENAIVRAQDSTAELASRRAAGVEGSPEVTAQQQRIDDAVTAEQDAAQRVRDARVALADASVAAAQRVADAQDRVREAGERIVAASDAVAQAHKDVAEAQQAEKDALDKVNEAELDHIDQQGQIAGLLFGNEGKTRFLLDAYRDHANALAPDSPLRRNLEGYIGDLERALYLELAGQNGPAPVVPPTRDPDRGAGPGRASVPGGKAPRLGLPDPGKAVGTKLTPAAGASSELRPLQVGPFYVDGNPDEAALAQIERKVKRAVADAMREVGTR